MYTGNHRYRCSGVDPDGKWRCKGHGEIGAAVRDRIDRWGSRRDRTHIAEIGEPFGTQQLLGHVLWRIADAGDLYKAHGRGFKWSLCGARCRRADEAGGSGQGERGQKLPP